MSNRVYIYPDQIHLRMVILGTTYSSPAFR